MSAPTLQATVAPTMKLHRRFQPNRGPIDMTALVDIVLLLLIFFMLSSSFVTQPGIRVDPPRSLYGVGSQANPLIIAVVQPPAQIDPQTGLPVPQDAFLFFQDRLMNLADLDRALAAIPQDSFSQPVVLKSDKETPLGLVTDVMNTAMRHGFSVIIATERSGASNVE